MTIKSKTNLQSFADELYQIKNELTNICEDFNSDKYRQPLEKLAENAQKVGKSWSGSWFGYQSRVYYKDLTIPPPGAHFSSEWGFYDAFSNDTSGEWEEFDFDDVRERIINLANSPDLSEIRKLSDQIEEKFNELKPQLVSILETSLFAKEDNYLRKLLEKAEETKIYTASEFVEALRPTGKLFSRDTLALSQGLQTPPHIAVLTEIHAIEYPFDCCDKLSKISHQAASHIERLSKNSKREERIGTNIFIGHGQSKEWKELKDFIQDRLQLPWDEFNRVPIAGITNIARLSEMLDSAAFAFLVMTAEDEQADGSLQARMNVIHEAGLFQGRLGFNRAIVLLENGCEEFSNIQGLGQIRFPTGNIKAVFEDIREVLERENIIESEK